MAPKEGRNEPRFATILSGRANNARPSELEVHLREHCHKVRVTEKLSGAHLVFPSESSLAVRVYYPADLEALRAKIAAAAATEEEEPNNDVDVDGLAQFSAKFRNAMVIVVLPEASDATEDSESAMLEQSVILEHMQHILENTECTNDSAPPRTFVVRSTQHAIEALTSVADSLRPSATNLKMQYLKRQEKELDPFNATGPGLAAWLLKDRGIDHKEAELLQSLASNVDSLIGNDMNLISCDARIKHLVRSLFESMPENADVVSVTPSSITPDASPPLHADPADPAMTIPDDGQSHYAMAPLQSYMAADHHHQAMAAYPSTPHHMIYYQQHPVSSTYVVRAPSSRLQGSALLVHPVSGAAFRTPALASRHFGAGGGDRYVGLDPNPGSYLASRGATQGAAAAAAPAQLAATVHPRGGVGGGGGTLATPRRGYHFPPK